MGRLSFFAFAKSFDSLLHAGEDSIPEAFFQDFVPDHPNGVHFRGVR